ncbi:hypothetical protein MBLNU230_g4657t1 [Neophaeotheca triangularis]
MTGFAVEVKALDHIVLTVKDLQATLHFYKYFLGFQHIAYMTNGEERHALRVGSQKINLHVAGKEHTPHSLRPTPGSGDLCFITETPIDKVLSNWRGAGVRVLEHEKIVERTGASGTLRSVFIRDPDGNLIE